MTNNPNILFLFPDQWRHDWIGLNPELDIRTPNLDRLARQGTRFTDVVCPSPLCAPSRACLALGVEYDRCPVKNNQDDLPLDRPTLYSRLRDAGYHTMGCGKFDLHKDTYRWGLDGKTDLHAWGFEDGIDNEGKMDAFLAESKGQRGPYMQYLEDCGLRKIHIADHDSRGNYPTQPTALPEEAYCDNWIAQNGLELIDGVPDGKNWFLQVNFTGPHPPWDVTERMWHSVRDRDLPPPINSTGEDDPSAIEVRRNYVAMLENIDRLIGMLLDKLEERGELDNTLVVFASDHGEMLRDHDLWGKCTWRHASLNVPLIVTGPDAICDQTCDQPTELLDLAATVLDAAGLDIPADWDARSLFPVLRGEKTAVRSLVTAGLSVPGRWDWRTAANRRWKLVQENDKTFLFNRLNDPEELENIAADHPETVCELRKLQG